MNTTVVRVRSVQQDRAAIAEAARRLVAGELVVLPTETVYGLAARPESEAALRAAKGRDDGKPFTWAVASREAAEALIDLSAHGAGKLARRFWPGPLTLVALRREGAGTLGVRVPAHPVIQAVLEAFSGPLLLTSANRSGEPDATTAEEARADLDGRVPLILDAGPSALRQASTVVSFEGPRAIVHRDGVIDRGMVWRAAARQVLLVCSGNTCRSPMAEGILRSHWAERLGVKADALIEHGGLVQSAGVSALPGMRASDEAVGLLAPRGIDLKTHRARMVNPDLVRGADFIWTMTAGHAQALAQRFPDVAKKVALLDPEGRDIPDPIGQGIDAYRRCLKAIEQALQSRMAALAPA